MPNQANHLAPVLTVRNLKAYFHTSEGLARAVDDISFEVRPKEVFCLVGESGCGKTVTSLAIMQLLPEPSGYVAGGEIILDGLQVLRLGPHEKRELRGAKAAMIFQEPMTSLNPVMRVGKQVAEALLVHRHVSRAAARDAAIDMLRKVGIPAPEQRYYEYPHQLSGGMKQRIMIAMALICHPKLLIADEPTTALDVTVQAQVLALMKRLQEETGTSILLITHDLGVVNQMADHVAVMYAGKIVEKGTRHQIFSQPLHPYTVRLLEALPGRERRGTSLRAIPGMVPKATQYPVGCRFAERCDRAMPACRTELPELAEQAPGHAVACHLYGPDVVHVSLASTLRPTAHAGSAAGDGGPLVELRELKVHFPVRKGVLQRVVNHVRAVDGVSFTIPRGRTLALVGESGCGKTTVGKALLQLIRPTGGSVLFETSGQACDITTLSRAQLIPFRRRMQLVFQDPYSSLNPRMMVGDLIKEGMRAHDLGGSEKERDVHVRELLHRMGLDRDMALRYPHEFSGGQRQRLAIARALAVDPEFIVLDEPTSALDASIQAQIVNLLKELQGERHLTYLFVTHNLGLVEYLADQVLVMYLGRFAEEGSVEEVFGAPKHPYTQALLAAVPRVQGSSGVEKIVLGGDVPSPLAPPPGCPFHPRCPKAMDICRKEYPHARRIGETHTVACHLGQA